MGESLSCGILPLPPLMWQVKQVRALNTGPNPSRAAVAVGALIQGGRANALPA